MLIVLIGYLLWLVGLPRSIRYPVKYFPGISIPAVCLILIAILSLIQAQDKQLAFFKVMLLVELFLIYFYVANHIRTNEEFQFFDQQGRQVSLVEIVPDFLIGDALI